MSYASFIDRTVAEALSGIPYEQIETFDENAIPYYLKVLHNNDIMINGYAYWILVREDCIWTINNDA